MKHFFALACLLAGACSHTSIVHAPAPTANATTPAAPLAPPPTTEVVAVAPNVAVAADLAKRCSIELTQQAPKFDFDTAELLPADRDVLTQIARCVVSGPLKGKRLELTGRADPRGTDEYNLGLGSRRAGTVRQFLERLGVADHQLGEATRGALDATGADEAGWRVDRRVDVTVGG